MPDAKVLPLIGGAPDSLYLYVEEAAELLGCSVKTVRRRIWERELRALRLGGRMCIKPEAIDDYLGVKRGTTAARRKRAARQARG